MTATTESGPITSAGAWSLRYPGVVTGQGGKNEVREFTGVRRLQPDADLVGFIGRVEDREFMTMSRMFGKHGGMVTADELVQSMRTNLAQPLSIVGRWIAERAAVQFAWRAQTWFPCFQFAVNPMSIRSAVSQIVLELRDAYDDWELALWFASRNEWLGHASPVEVIGRDAAATVSAARIDRFITKG